MEKPDLLVLSNGACHYCGQIMSVPKDSGYAPDEYATKYCGCDEARRKREIEEAKERRRQEREATLKRAADEIEDLCGAEDFGRWPIDDNIKYMLRQAAELIYDGKMKSVTFNVTSYIKLSISKSSKEKLQITRSNAAAYKREI